MCLETSCFEFFECLNKGMIEIEFVPCILFIQLQYGSYSLHLLYKFHLLPTKQLNRGPFSKPLAGSHYSLPFLTTGKGLSCNSDLR